MRHDFARDGSLRIIVAEHGNFDLAGHDGASTRIFMANSAASVSAERVRRANALWSYPRKSERSGFTKTGYSNSLSITSWILHGSRSHSWRCTVTHGTTGILATCSRRLATSLSIPMAEPSTPAPTKGRPARSSKP